VIIVETAVSSGNQFLNKRDKLNKKKMPQMNANRDKNKSQRIRDFSLK
jgi:hypothetical protein